MNGHFLSQTRRLNRHYQSVGAGGVIYGNFSDFCYPGFSVYPGDEMRYLQFIPATGQALSICHYPDSNYFYNVDRGGSITLETGCNELWAGKWFDLSQNTPILAYKYNRDYGGSLISNPMYTLMWDCGSYEVDNVPVESTGSGQPIYACVKFYNGGAYSLQTSMPVLRYKKVRIIVLFCGYEADISGKSFITGQAFEETRYPYDITASWPQNPWPLNRNTSIYLPTSWSSRYAAMCEDLIRAHTTLGRPFNPSTGVRYSIPINEIPIFDEWGDGGNVGTSYDKQSFLKPIEVSTDWDKLLLVVGEGLTYDLSAVTQYVNIEKHGPVTYSLGSEANNGNGSCFYPTFGLMPQSAQYYSVPDHPYALSAFKGWFGGNSPSRTGPWIGSITTPLSQGITHQWGFFVMAFPEELHYGTERTYITV